MEGLNLATAATAPAVSLSEVKDHLRITGTSEDAVLLGMIDAAEQYAELVTRRAFIQRTYKQTLPAFPDGGRGLLYLPMPPLISVTAVKYWDTSDPSSQATLASEKYQVETSQEPGLVEPIVGESWPNTEAREAAVEVEFVAGYANQSDIPASIAIAIKMLAGAFYDAREAMTVVKMHDLPASLAVDRLLENERVQRFS